MEVISVQITRNQSTYVIEPIAEQERLSYDTNNITGDPSWYSMYGGLFIPYPRPSDVYTATFNVVKEPATLSVSGDSNVFTEHAEDLITARAAANVCLKYTEDYERAQTFKLLEQEALMELYRRNAARTPTRVIPTEF